MFFSFFFFPFPTGPILDRVFLFLFLFLFFSLNRLLVLFSLGLLFPTPVATGEHSNITCLSYPNRGEPMLLTKNPGRSSHCLIIIQKEGGGFSGSLPEHSDDPRPLRPRRLVHLISHSQVLRSNHSIGGCLKWQL